MAWITDARLAAAVSAAGGLGTIGPNPGADKVTSDVEETGERLRDQIRLCREFTDRPFAVNFVVGVMGWDRQYSDRCVTVGIEEKVPVAIVSQGSPAVYTERLKDAGMTVIHVCSTVRHVIKAELSGVDAVVVSGTEGGGHSGFDQITTLCLVPQAADATNLPIIAGGGIVDARGLTGALSLGADGIYMGTRFIATRECPAHDNVKQALLDAVDTSTMAIRHGSPLPVARNDSENRGFVEERRGSVRMLLNDYLKKLIAREGMITSFDQVVQGSGSDDPVPESSRTVDAFLHGNLETNSITAGQGAAMIWDIPSCAELIASIVGETGPIMKRLNRIFG